MTDRTHAASKLHLSVVIPAYDEAARLRRHLPQIFDWLRANAIDGEVIVADDGSRDDTAAVATAALHGQSGKLVRSAENVGKGHAVRQGFAAASGRWVLVSDADLSTPLEEYERLATTARDRDLDIAVGSRGLPASRVEKHQHPARELMGQTFNRFVRVVTGLPFRDTQCGFKLLHRGRVAPLFEMMRVDGFAWDVELLFLAVRFGLGVGEVPVRWIDSERTTVHVLRDPPRMLWDVLRIRWSFRVGAYDPATTTAGRKASRPSRAS